MTHRDESMACRVTRIRHELTVSNEIKAMRDPSGQVELFASGPVADDLQSLAMVRPAELKLIDVLLEGGGG